MWEKKTGQDIVLDARGLKCPLPVLKLEKALAGAPAQTRIVVLTTDPVARIDIPHYCQQQGHEVMVEPAADGTNRFVVVKSPGEEMP